jgi:hypothetical protein
MEVLHPHCAGLDVHKDSVVACVRHRVDGKVTRPSRRRPRALMARSDWLSAEGVTHMAMEATGVSGLAPSVRLASSHWVGQRRPWQERAGAQAGCERTPPGWPIGWPMG